MKAMANLRNCTKNCMKQGVYAILGTSHATNINSRSNPSVRTFSRTSHLAKSRNFYDDLEIPRTATQSEIKSAYYTLSMIYHPDKNKTEKANAKFRRITEAYEVVGNFRTRRMYDKGIRTFVGAASAQSPGTESEILHEEVEDDAQTKFYKQHMVKSQPPSMAGRVSARDFDEWSAVQIRQSFIRQQQVKELIRNREEDKREARQRAESLGYGYYIGCMVICCTIIYEWYRETTHNAKLQRLNQKES